ncbi:MAG: trigger factor [Lachnospiraceae bacterium]|nr:trigger factor [Lachnospiraceae bacterium]
MNVPVEKKEKNTAVITVTVGPEELEKAMDQAYKKQKNRINIPGFRKGKVPRKMIEKMYGPEMFYDDAANEIMRKTYPDAYDESGLEIVSQPEMDVVQIESGKDFIYTATVATKPPVTLGKYKGVEVTKGDTKVTKKEVEEAVKRELEMNSRMEVVDRKAGTGDTVNIDYEGSIDGVKFEGGSAKGQPLNLGSGTFIPGFEDQLVGASAGDDVEVKVTFPEDYHAKDLAGKEAIFKTHVNSVSEKNVPKLTDEYIQDTTEFETVDEYKKDLEEKLVEKKKETVRRDQEDEAILKIVEDSEMDIPDQMLEYQVQTMINDMAGSMMQQGLNFNDYLKYTGTTLEKLEENVRPDALSRIKSSLVLEAIAEKEGFEVSDEDVDKELEEMGKMYGMKAEDLKKNLTESEEKNIKKDIQVKKAIDYIIDNAKEKAKKKEKKEEETEAKED